MYLFTRRREECLYNHKQNEIGQTMCLIPDCALEVLLALCQHYTCVYAFLTHCVPTVPYDFTSDWCIVYFLAPSEDGHHSVWSIPSTPTTPTVPSLTSPHPNPFPAHRPSFPPPPSYPGTHPPALLPHPSQHTMHSPDVMVCNIA